MDNLKKFAPYVAIFVLILLIIFFTSQKNEMKNGALPNNFSTHADNLDEAIKNVPQIQFFTSLKEPLDLKIVDGKEFCFADYSFSVNNDATYMLDGGTMRLKIDGSKVTGKSVFAIAEKDAWITTYEGAVKDLDLKTNTRVLDVWEEQQSEGSTYPKENKKLILTGDNELVARKVCTEVGLKVERVVLGSEVETMSSDDLARTAEAVDVFAKLEPHHKERIIRSLRSKGHVVGYMGDGINDAPALRAADVGVSVDSAVDIAKEASDIILLEKNLLVLKAGVRDGRKVFGNIVKYIRMTASSNFGNMFSVVGASAFLPFLPMLPIQVITNNLMYDLSQVTIPTDGVDEEYLKKPRQWRINSIRKYILTLGPVSSLFDYATFALLAWGFAGLTNPALFRTGWFVESLLSQTLIIHIIRTNRVPFLQSRASATLIASSLLICALGVWLPFSSLAPALGFVPLPASYFGAVALLLLAYFALAHLAQRWFMRKFGDN